MSMKSRLTGSKPTPPPPTPPPAPNTSDKSHAAVATNQTPSIPSATNKPLQARSLFAGKFSSDPSNKTPQSTATKPTNGIEIKNSNGTSNNTGMRNGSKKNDRDISTHIEVCARIRPLEILVKREGFFDSKKSTSSSSPSRIQPRKPPVPGHLGDTSSPGAPSASAENENDSIVAWNVSAEGDTASQSSLTDLIQGRTHSYTLDRVYPPDSSTKKLYDKSVMPLVKAAMEGYHSSILAYGQTSTGKTFTMTGTQTSPGLIPRAIGDCFRYLKSCPESRLYLFRISYLEIYNEQIRDLLAADGTAQTVRLFEHKTEGLVIRGLKEEVVTSPDHVFAVLRQGESRRQVGATHMNLHSSRSHTMVRLWIESTPNPEQVQQELDHSNNVAGKVNPSTRISSLSLVDLAGSESVRLNGVQRREEGHYINKSLMTLGKVVSALSEKSKPGGHIPYRDSKLTRLLQPSLSGNARMVMICCISPLVSHLEESHNTFKFATRAKKIEQKAVVNVAADEQTLLQAYRDEIEDLRKQLADAKEQQRVLEEQKVTDVTAQEEVEELVEAIQSMERLILKSHTSRQGGRRSAKTPSPAPQAHDENRQLVTKESSEENDVDLLAEVLDDEVSGEEEEAVDLRVDVQMGNDEGLFATPERGGEKGDEDDLQQELHRIRGLLGSVLQRRSAAAPSPAISVDAISLTSPESSGGNLLFRTPPRPTVQAAEDANEVQTLKKQLEQQELATNLKKADATFLQNQLREKDNLLEEIAKVLEAVEKRQNELERENYALKEELAYMQSRLPDV